MNSPEKGVSMNQISKYNKSFDRLNLGLDAGAFPEMVVKGDKYRFTVLTECLIRLEYNENGNFEDRPSQGIWNRKLDKVLFETVEEEDLLIIRTSKIELHYNKSEFTPLNLFITMQGKFGGHENIWYYGEIPNTLKGTRVGLDRTDGQVPLSEGLCSREGFAIIDDSLSYLITQDGFITPREKGVVDIYYFGYGYDYEESVKDYYRITGAPPMLPRKALGNWWSRYYPYTEETYKELINRFKEEDIPFSMAVLDMDWHITDLPEKYGRGWTGHTWNKELFPNHIELLDWLHDNHMMTALNIHPEEGIHAYEDKYEALANRLGIDSNQDEKIPFNVFNQDFINSYITEILEPLEKEGVDLWWMDFYTKQAAGFANNNTPLWILNHYLSLNSGKDGKRPLLLSRNAGIGGHRYPIGFSGDTSISWDAFRFQPYFTATSSNMGFVWWSHDIGGFMMGTRDDELFVRWAQFGVFSPINRMHSANSMFSGKEPWKYGMETEKTIGKFLRFRHRLIPYLYSEAYACNTKLKTLSRPLYYDYPEIEAAYNCPNQYWFGSQIIVSPITEKRSLETGMAGVDVWLPKGTWTDIFNGRVYTGNRMITMYRTLSEIPVFAKAGAILPLAVHTPHDNNTDNPELIEVQIFPGASGSYELYEDDGISKESAYCITRFDQKWEDGHCEFTLDTKGDINMIPDTRAYRICFKGFGDADKVRVIDRNGVREIPYQKSYDKKTHSLIITPAIQDKNASYMVILDAKALIWNNEDVRDQIMDFVVRYQIEYRKIEKIDQLVSMYSNENALISDLFALHMKEEILGPMLEVLVAR